jgi:hypothetical protein
MDPYPTKDLLNGKYGDPEKTPMTVDIGTADITLDVGK